MKIKKIRDVVCFSFGDHVGKVEKLGALNYSYYVALTIWFALLLLQNFASSKLFPTFLCIHLRYVSPKLPISKGKLDIKLIFGERKGYILNSNNNNNKKRNHTLYNNFKIDWKEKKKNAVKKSNQLYRN